MHSCYRIGRLAGIACFTAATCWFVSAAPDNLTSQTPAVQFRRPIAAAFLDGGQTLFVANQRSGSVSVVDVKQGRPHQEFTVGRHLTDLAVLPDRRHLLVTDDAKHELLVLSWADGNLSVRTRLAVGPYPASIAVQPDGKCATVASVWSRRVEVVDLEPLSSTGPVSLRIRHTIHLPFAPRNQCLLPADRQVAVADAFGGHLAIVDAVGGRVLTVHALHAHNLRGLTLDPSGGHLLVTHQQLNQKVPTTRENIESGVLMANGLRSLALKDLLTDHADLEPTSRLLPLGGVGAGASDPAGLAFVGEKQIAVALAGVQEVALVRLDGVPTQRIAVGRRPTAIVATAPGQPFLAVNTFDDSLSEVDPRQGRVTRTISLGPQPTPGPADRGELLFFDARLARDGWLSCHSCHTDGHTNGLLADTLGDNSYGTPKRTLSLRGTALTDPWAWNGEVKYLHDQVQKSLEETMHGPAIGAEQANDLSSFLHTLPPPPPLEPATGDQTERARIDRGRRIFEKRGCVHCHIPPLTYSSHDVHDVGFADERGLRKYNPPSLRGVGQGYRFLHDGRAATLEEVFTKYRHKVEADMPEAERTDLLRFLQSL
jgi:DNA-binding beta-propeller fold protein YncE